MNGGDGGMDGRATLFLLFLTFRPTLPLFLLHVVRRVEEPVASHLEAEGLELVQFAFRWANCLLLRELPFSLGIRLWDTYLAEG